MTETLDTIWEFSTRPPVPLKVPEKILWIVPSDQEELWENWMSSTTKLTRLTEVEVLIQEWKLLGDLNFVRRHWRRSLELRLASLEKRARSQGFLGSREERRTLEEIRSVLRIRPFLASSVGESSPLVLSPGASAPTPPEGGGSQEIIAHSEQPPVEKRSSEVRDEGLANSVTENSLSSNLPNNVPDDPSVSSFSGANSRSAVISLVFPSGMVERLELKDQSTGGVVPPADEVK